MSKIEILDFDTQLFGFNVGKLINRKLSPTLAKEIIKECETNNIKCVYANLNMNDYNSLNIAVKYGFSIVDIRIIFEKDLIDSKIDNVVDVIGYRVEDIVKPSDIPYLEVLSREISQISRFSFDKKFPRGSAEKLYTLWMRNSIQKKVADNVFFAREIESKKPIGFVTCKKDSDNGEIVLVGVSKDHSGKGIASLILQYACSYFKRDNLKKARVVTQGNNVPALRLYQKNGFLINEISLFFHLWLE